ncbi:MAG: hypothetical protein JWM27_3314 [Gemmatimonadetes bacterium]|nr:hypothetical protein [Gemmatimonadota bacterium]
MNARIHLSRTPEAAPARSALPSAPALRRCLCGERPDVERDQAGRGAVRRSAAGPAPAVAPPAVHDILRSPGQALDAGTRAYMEPRFGHSFADVRVHADGAAADSARAVGARAYAVGSSVVFGSGRYAPGTPDGRRLIAHELAHVVQQSGAPRGPSTVHASLEIGPSDAPEEREADRAADAVVGGGAAAVSGVGGLRVSRTDDGGAPVDAGPVDAGPVPQQDGGVDGGAPDAGPAAACPVAATGTLSKVSWGETGGLYPITKEADVYKQGSWDASKVCEILRMRAAVHEVATRGQKTKSSSPPSGDKFAQSVKKYHFVENFPSVDATVAVAEVKWFYLSNDATTPASHPSVPGSTRVQSYGSFFNVGGGDVPKGATWVHFYKK